MKNKPQRKTLPIINLNFSYPAWVPCDCGNFLCSIHWPQHVEECPCPEIDDWGEINPYYEGGKPVPMTISSVNIPGHILRN